MTRAATEPKRVVCVACNRIIVASKNGHPRRHVPNTNLRRGYSYGYTCDGTFMPGKDVSEEEPTEWASAELNYFSEQARKPKARP